MSLRASDKAFAAFAKFHSATMVPILASGGWWPGFSYTEDEQDAMRDQFARFPSGTSRLYVFGLFLMAPITIALFLIPILIMAWVITSIQQANGGKLPEVLFYPIFLTTMALCLSVMLPLGYYLACLIYSRRSNPEPADSKFGRRLFSKYCWQVGRVAVVAGLVAVVIAALPFSSSSRLGFWSRSALPLVASAIQAGTLGYYYRMGKKLENQVSAQPETDTNVIEEVRE